MRADREWLLDEIDLIALGHVPGGPVHAHSRSLNDLDLTDVPRDGWGSLVLAEARRMVPGESLVAITPAPPYRMLDEVHAVMGDACMIEYLATGPNTWVAALTRIA